MVLVYSMARQLRTRAWNVLTKLRIYLSTTEQKMYLTAADAHKETSVPSEH